jgi:hypothetical protein
MLLEVRTVGRKTPIDGKLEIAAATARRLQLLGSGLPLVMGDQRSVASIVSLTCSKCARAAEGAHEHWFVESVALRELSPGDAWALELTPDGTLELTQAPGS